MTPKQRLFCLEYLVDCNGTQAAIRAGYSERSAASIAEENLKKPELAEFVAAHLRRRETDLEITVDRIAAEYAKIGFSDIRKAARWQTSAMTEDEVDEDLEAQPHGGALKRARRVVSADIVLVDSEDLDDDTAAAISEISQGPNGPKIKMHNKLEALNALSRWKGMFKDEIQINGPVKFVIEGAPAQGTKS